MLNAVLEKLLKRFNLNKYVQNVRLVTDEADAVNADFVLKLNRTKFMIAFDVGNDYKDELNLLRSFLP